MQRSRPARSSHVIAGNEDTFSDKNTLTLTPTLTATPSLGAFENPIPLGATGSVRPQGTNPYTVTMTILEIKEGDQAKEIAKETLDNFVYEEPIESQEYLAVKVHLLLTGGNENEVQSLYSFWHLTLRYEEAGEDLWSMYYRDIDEGYPPVEHTAWVFWLIRSGSQPLIYFQTDLLVAEQLGDRESGLYFSINP